jgi:hypothetical protein
VISILPIVALVRTIAVVYAAIVAAFVALIWKFSDDPSLWSSVGLAFSGATALNLVLLGIAYLAWKRVWTRFPALNRLIFPDMNGSWDMLIYWQSAEKSGVKNARALIKQDLLKISMEVSSEDSESETMTVVPKRDPVSGRPILFYVYRVIPKNIANDAGPSYEGAAILKLSNSGDDGFSGNYFTSRRTTGHFELTRASGLKRSNGIL